MQIKRVVFSFDTRTIYDNPIRPLDEVEGRVDILYEDGTTNSLYTTRGDKRVGDTIATLINNKVGDRINTVKGEKE